MTHHPGMSDAARRRAGLALPTDLTVADILAYYGYEGREPGPEPWGGFGYLGAIGHRAADTEAVRLANEALIARANQLGWDRDRLWTFLNSEAGRWYAEDATGTSGFIPPHTPTEMAACIGADAQSYNWSLRKCPNMDTHR